MLFNPLRHVAWMLLMVSLLGTLFVTLQLQKERAAHIETRMVAAEREAMYAEQVSLSEQAYAAAVWQARETEQELRAAATQLEEKKDAEIRSANARADNLFRRLRASEAARSANTPAPSEPAPAPPAPAFEPGSFGAEFPGPSGDLVSEALRAEAIKLSLLQCYDLYDRALDALLRLSVPPE